MTPDFSANRFEIKYVMHAATAKNLQVSLSDIVVPDDHSSSVSEGYYNHSIYFDSYSLQRYLEKHEGNDQRIKIRLRSYRDSPDAEAKQHSLELKHRLGGIVKKDRVVITVAQAKRLLRSNLSISECLDVESPVLQTYAYHAKVSHLRPIIAVQYHRAAYHTQLYPGVRITFDRRVMASKDTSLPGLGRAIPHVPALNPRFMVVELKYNDQVPRLLINRIREHEGRQATFSKYATAMEKIYA